eukprot:1145986-Pelagomonas_calceolata.AAC.1
MLKSPKESTSLDSFLPQLCIQGCGKTPSYINLFRIKPLFVSATLKTGLPASVHVGPSAARSESTSK